MRAPQAQVLSRTAQSSLQMCGVGCSAPYPRRSLHTFAVFHPHNPIQCENAHGCIPVSAISYLFTFIFTKARKPQNGTLCDFRLGLPSKIAHHLLRFGLFLVRDDWRFVFGLFPRELVECLRIMRWCAVFLIPKHAGQRPLQSSGCFPLWAIPSAHACQVAIHLPPLHLVKEVLGCDSALANYPFV